MKAHGHVETETIFDINNKHPPKVEFDYLTHDSNIYCYKSVFIILKDDLICSSERRKIMKARSLKSL